MPEPDRQPSTASGPSSAGRRAVGLVVLVCAAVWLWAGTGLVSSNDGSHLALGRAIVLRGEPEIDREVGLTLWVDRARRGGHQYSDRPPGTALLGLPAIWIGDRLDGPLFRRSLETRDVTVTPAGPRYAETYQIRVERTGKPSVSLLALQGTAIAIAVHGLVVGLAGLWCVWRLLVRRGVGVGGQAFALGALGLCSLWGPYSTVLFSHVTAGVGLVGLVLALDVMGDDGLPVAQFRRIAVVGGLCGGWAVSADYLVVLAVVPLCVMIAPRRAWPWIAAGVVPIAVCTAAYHHAAFGSIWSIGYDHQANFRFARARATTFDGHPLEGLWVLLGAGRSAGMLAKSPIMLAGLGALTVGAGRRWLAGVSVWLIALSMHHTPWGGASGDHRYLVPILPVVAVGLGIGWQRWATGDKQRLVAVTAVVLAAASAVLGWSGFLEGR